MNKDFGFEINRPFYIRSRMSMNRFIAYKGNSSLGIKSWVDGDKDFKWVFDGTTKTIKTLYWAAKPNSLTIMGNGT